MDSTGSYNAHGPFPGITELAWRISEKAFFPYQLVTKLTQARTGEHL